MEKFKGPRIAQNNFEKNKVENLHCQVSNLLQSYGYQEVVTYRLQNRTESIIALSL